MKEERQIDTRFTILSILFVCLMLISNLLACKVLQLGSISVTPGIFIYPFSFMLGDVITELYGFKNTKKIIWVGLIVQLALVLFSQLAMIAPYPIYWEGQIAFETIFGTTPQIVLGSLLAFVIGGLANAKIMSVLKKKHNGKHLWIRTISSSIIGEILDSLIFVTIAFIGRMPLEAILIMIVTQVVVKTLIEAVFGTPLAYLFINKTKNKKLTN